MIMRAWMGCRWCGSVVEGTASSCGECAPVVVGRERPEGAVGESERLTWQERGRDIRGMCLMV